MQNEFPSIDAAPKHADEPFARIELIPAERVHEPVMANLLELYIHDFSEFHDCEIGEDGRFGYRSLALYLNEPDRHAFLIRANGKLAGFVFVTSCPGGFDNHFVWDMAEFFILRGYRRRGIGTQVAHEIWKLLPGQWEVRVMQKNLPAQRFWARAISSFIGEDVNPVRDERGRDWWQIFSFETGRLA